MTDPDQPLIVRMRHLRAAKFCSQGIRSWFEAHGLSFSSFLEKGIPAADLEATGDVFALRVVAIARAEAAEAG